VLFRSVSAGFDAHEHDPLGGMRLTTPAFAAMTAELRQIAEECCRGRIVAVTEGGYDLHALAACADAVVEILKEPTNTPWPSSPVRSSRGPESVALARAALSSHWSFETV